MLSINRRYFRALFVLTIAGVGFGAWKAGFVSSAFAAPLQRSTDRRATTKPIPPEGVAENDTQGRVPGNPQHTMNDMQRLYQMLHVYQRLHNGELPDNAHRKSLVSDIVLHPKDYGFTTGDQMKAFFYNPDMKYADARQHDPHPESVFPYIITPTRPDGTPSGAAKSPGMRDILAYTDMYVHLNIRTFKGDRTTTKPAGYYLVLWDDGQVQRIPFVDVRYAAPKSVGRGGFTQALIFPGQAGAPLGSLSRTEYENQLHEKIKRL